MVSLVVVSGLLGGCKGVPGGCLVVSMVSKVTGRVLHIDLYHGDVRVVYKLLAL